MILKQIVIRSSIAMHVMRLETLMILLITECLFIAQVDCVILEIRHCMERDSSGAANEVGKLGLSISANNLIDNFTVPAESGQTTSTDVPTEETNGKDAAKEEEMVEKKFVVPDENIHSRRVAAIDEESCSSNQSTGTEGAPKQFLTSTISMFSIDLSKSNLKNIRTFK